MLKEDKMQAQTVEEKVSVKSVEKQKKSSMQDKIIETAKKYKEIEVALLANDNSSFLLLGNVWTPELSRMAAKLAVEISSVSENWVNGGYRDSLLQPNDMKVIFERNEL